MISRTIGGWALLASSLLILVFLFASSHGIGGAFLPLTGSATNLLFIAALPAIWSRLPHSGHLGRLGVSGLWFLFIGSAIAVVVQGIMLTSTTSVADIFPLSSAIAGLVGNLLLGGVTIRTRAFHPVIGGLLIVSGVLNLVGGLLPDGALTTGLNVVGTLALIGSFGGIGLALLVGGKSQSDSRTEAVEAR